MPCNQNNCLYNGMRSCDCICHGSGPVYCSSCNFNPGVVKLANTEDLKSSEVLKPLEGSSPSSGKLKVWIKGKIVLYPSNWTAFEIIWHIRRCGCSDPEGFLCKRHYPLDPDWCDIHGWEMVDCHESKSNEEDSKKV